MQTSRILKPIFLIIYTLLHVGVKLWLWIQSLLTQTNNLIFGFQVNDSNCVDYLRTKTAHLKKNPTHVAVCVDEDQVHLLDAISRVVSWNIAIGRQIITVYDKQGTLKKEKAQLESQIQKNLIKILGDKSKSASFQITIPQSPTKLETTQKEVANEPNSKATNILIMSATEGKDDIVRVCKQFCQEVENKRLTSTDLTVDLIQRNIVTRDIEDPQMIMKFGNPTLAGFLPWQVRLSEIYFFDNINHFTVQTLARCLARYSNCDQRFGT